MKYNQIANDEFGMDYNQLGPNEKEWVRENTFFMNMYYNLTE